MRQTLLLVMFLVGCMARAEDPPAESQQAQVQVQVEDAAETISKTADSMRALVCRFKDVDALAAKAPDIPSGWAVPKLLVYEAEGSTCSQIPSRQQAELVARAACEAAPMDSEAPAVQCSWTVEEVWAHKGGPPAPDGDDDSSP